MRGGRKLLDLSNIALGRANLRISQVRSTYWDRVFRRWVADAKASGVDPNELGDADWDDDRLQLGIDEWYLADVTDASTMVELGPGSGRLTRHLIGRCRHLTLLDFSPVVCQWMDEYLAGKGSFEVCQISGAKSGLAAGSIDAVVAHGVVEHLDQETLFAFLKEFSRILRQGGTFVFTFDCLLSDFAATYLSEHGNPYDPGRFRLYHPDAIARLAEMTGFQAKTFHDGDRIAFAALTKR